MPTRRLLSFASLLVLLPGRTPAQGVAPQAIQLSGRVVGISSGPIAGAVVSVNESSVVIADSIGVIRLALVEGPNLLHVRALGFAPLDTQFVATRQSGALELLLQSVVTTLATVTISASGTQKPARYSETTRFDEFYERRHTAIGGTFLTREEIEKAPKQDIIDVLRGMPGVRVDQDRYGLPTVVFSRCKTALTAKKSDKDEDKTVQVFLDGQKVAEPQSALQMLKTSDVEAMEVYQGVSELPQVPRGDGCGAIFIWTRYGGSAP